MLNRILSALAGLPRALWRNTVGRLTAASPPTAPLVVAEPVEPRSVAGITFRASLVVAGVVLASYLLYELRLLLILIFLAVLLAAGLYGARPVLRAVPAADPGGAAGLRAAHRRVLAGDVLIFPPLIRQVVEFADDLPSLADDLRAGAISFIDGVAGRGPRRGDRRLASPTGPRGPSPSSARILWCR